MVEAANQDVFKNAGATGGSLTFVVPDGLAWAFQSNAQWAAVSAQTAATVSFVEYSTFMGRRGNANAVQILENACRYASTRDYDELIASTVTEAMDTIS